MLISALEASFISLKHKSYLFIFHCSYQVALKRIYFNLFTGIFTDVSYLYKARKSINTCR